VSTAVREAVDAVQAHHPSTSLALVPLVEDWHVTVEGSAPPRPRPGRWHWFFYGLGYAGLAMLVLGGVVSGRDEEGMVVCFGLGAGFTGLASLGVLVHLVIPPRTQHKLRTTLGAVASLLLTIALLPVVMHVSREVRAESLVPVAQRFVDREARPPSVAEKRGSGIAVVDFEPGYLLLLAEGVHDWWMLYPRPGHPLPSPGAAVAGLHHWHTQPLGGGWYILASGD
jgi:hypothetical protein